MMTLKEYWEEETLPSVIGITFKDGKTLNIKNSQSKCLGSYDFTESTLSEDEYIETMEVQIYFELDVSETGGKVIGGAVDMGNEGFILYLDKDEEIQWSMFQTFSNPFFNTTTVQGDIIHAVTELGHNYTIPIFNPQNISCISNNKY